jgi:hypothetical protein
MGMKMFGMTRDYYCNWKRIEQRSLERNPVKGDAVIMGD